MCDNIIAPPGSTSRRIMLFGKNSDRQSNEAQIVESFPRTDHAKDAQLKCTYITVPQASRTHAVLLCRPFWIWGAEMGANEHGVVMGNEGIHARSAPFRKEALTGMDLLRLALERASTAAQAVEVTTELLGRFGQGGNCGHLTPAYYHNGFVVADTMEAFVVETVGREWLVERVRGVRAISNAFSIGREVDAVSAGLLALVQESGWTAEAKPNYADTIADPHREHIGNARARRACSTSLLNSRAGRLTAADMMRILRDHGRGDRFHPEWRSECLTERTVCMHAGAEGRPGQTVGSMVSELMPGRAVHWVTGTAAPCVSIFKPVLLEASLPQQGPLPTDRFDPRTLWWRHECLHRSALLGDFAKFLDEIRAEREALEAAFGARINAVLDGGSIADRSQIVAECWKEALETEDRWFTKVKNKPLTPTHPIPPPGKK